MIRTLWIHGPTVLIAVSLFVLSSISNLNSPDLGFDWQDKLYHSLAYAVFGFFIQRSVYYVKLFSGRAILLVFILGASYGVLDEFHQYFVPGRSCHLFDMIADALGILLSLILFYKYFKIKFND